MAKDSQEAANVLQTINVIKKDTASKIKMQVQTQNQAQNAGSSTSKGFPNKSIKSSASKTHAGMPVVPTNMIPQMTVGGMGVSKNAKKADSLNHQVDSLKQVISRLQVDYALLVKDTVELHKQLDAKQTTISDLHARIATDSLDILKCDTNVSNLKEKVTDLQKSPIAALTSPSGCAVLIVLIIALTVIAVKKGVSISKGNTSISVGDNKK